jgi:heme exporter protein D
MPDLGPHASFIVAAYAVTALAVGALAGFVLGEDRRQRRQLAALERRGITRRSAKPKAETSATAKQTPKPGASRRRAARKPKS